MQSHSWPVHTHHKLLRECKNAPNCQIQVEKLMTETVKKTLQYDKQLLCPSFRNVKIVPLHNNKQKANN